MEYLKTYVLGGPYRPSLNYKTIICLKNYASGGLYLPFLIYEAILYVFGGLTPLLFIFRIPFCFNTESYIL